jgi:hypothetical protein
MRFKLTLDPFSLLADLFSQFKDFLLYFHNELVLHFGVFLAHQLQFGFDADDFLTLQCFLMFLLVFDLSNVVLNFFDHGFELGIFVGFILKFDCEFLDGIFQELESELVLTF